MVVLLFVVLLRVQCVVYLQYILLLLFLLQLYRRLPALSRSSGDWPPSGDLAIADAHRGQAHPGALPHVRLWLPDPGPQRGR